MLIADLGLAKALAAASGLTARAGTPGYMAPEQDDPFAVVDTRADVYGAGPARPPAARPGRRARGRRPRTSLRPDGGRPARRGRAAGRWRRCCAGPPRPRPADRYPDATAFRTALRHATTAPALPDPARSAAGSPCAPAGPSPRVGDRPAGRRRSGAVGLGVAALVAVGATARRRRARRRAAGTWTSGPVTVALPPGWRATGTGWAGQYGADGDSNRLW